MGRGSFVLGMCVVLRGKLGSIVSHFLRCGLVFICWVRGDGFEIVLRKEGSNFLVVLLPVPFRG